MINIAICDDNLKYLNYYAEKLNELALTYHVTTKIHSFKSGEELLFHAEDFINEWDILFLDIIMNDLNGIEVGKQLRKMGYRGIIIFLTASKEYALESFEVEPLNYIIKDLSNTHLLEATFMKALTQVEKNNQQKIMLSTKSANKIIDLSQIMYIESLGKKVILYDTANHSEEITMTMHTLINKIESHGFIQCHKSYIVNSAYVTSFNKVECVLKNKTTIPIGRKYAATFKGNYLKHELNHLIY